MRLRKVAARAAILALIAACAKSAPVPGDSGAPPDTSAPVEARNPDSTASLALDGEGLRVFLVPSGSARPIPFGQPRAAVTAAVGRVLQAQPTEIVENQECRATVATWRPSGLSLWFTPDSTARFVGWSLGARTPSDASAPTLTTASGIGLGSTRAALESAYVTRVGRSGLGVEFSAGGLAGVLASERPNAPIEHLWAGQVCLAR